MSRAIFRLDVDLYPNTITGMNETSQELENGAFVGIGNLLQGDINRETYGLDQLSADQNQVIGFVSSPSVMYESSKDERDFFCADGELVRVYKPNNSTVGTFAGKHFAEGYAGLVEGDKLYPKANSTQLTKTGTGIPVAEVISKEDFEGQPSLVIRFL